MKWIIFIIALLSALSLHAQSQLDVYCYSDTTSPGIYSNQTHLDSSLIEYGVGVSLTPKIKVVIFDDTCANWISHSFNDIGQNNPGTFGIGWGYFAYLHDDTSQLLSLDSLINYWIPNDHAFVIYTPMEFNGPQVAAICPGLTQTLSTNWGYNAAQSQSMMVLFGVQGYPSSFEIDTITSIDTTGSAYIHFQTQICPHASQVVGGNEIEKIETSINVHPNPSSSTVKVELNPKEIEVLKVMDVQGRILETIRVQNGQSDYIIKNLPSGNYYLRGFKENTTTKVVRFVVI